MLPQPPHRSRAAEFPSRGGLLRAALSLAAGEPGAAGGCALIPKPIRQRAFLQVNAALRASVRVVPTPDVVQRRNRALDFDRAPSEALHPALGQPAEDGLKARWRAAAAMPVRQPAQPPCAKPQQPARFVRHPKPRHGVVQFPAIAAQDRLDGEGQPPIRAPGDLGPVAALEALKPKGPAHASSSSMKNKKKAHQQGAPDYTRSE